MLNHFQKHLDKICPQWPDKQFMVAFSGGLDSSALIYLMSLSVKPEQLSAAHLNHQIRPEAASEQNFAKKISKKLKIDFISESRDVPLLAEERRRGIEEAARFARYEFFKQAVQTRPIDYLLTAHQADDQAETILMHLIKGGGGGGLAGIHQSRPLFFKNYSKVTLLRPLLPFNREQLRIWMEKMNLEWVEDASNQDSKYQRNALRLDIMPKLKKFNPKFLEAIGRSSTIMRDEENFWKNHISLLWEDLLLNESKQDLIIIKASKLKTLAIAEQRRIIYEAFLKIWRLRQGSPEPLAFTSIETVINMLEQNRRHNGLDLPGGVRAALKKDCLFISLASRLKKSE